MWRETAQFRQVEYYRVEVVSARVLPLRGEWPPEHRWALDLFLASPDSEGRKAHYTPRFIVASRQQNRLLLCSHGYGGWTHEVKPWLDQRFGET